MGKIFKQLTRHWAACLVVVALLIVQAYCDLSLPDYTSKIVDTGIQQGGIESPLPQTLRSSTLDALSLLMREEDAAAFENAYEYYVQDDGVLKLRSDLTADERAVLEETVTVPDIVLYMTVSQTANGTGMPAQSLTPLSEYPAASSGEEAASSAASATAESTDETETVAPTTDDLDAVCAQFAAMAQMPGFSREMIMMLAYEVPLLMIMLTVAMKVGGGSGAEFSLTKIMDYQAEHGSFGLTPVMWPAFLAWLMFLPATLGVPPFDQPEAETEILEGPLLEYSGVLLAFFHMASALKMVVALALGVVLFFPGTISDIPAVNLVWFVVKCALFMLFALTVVKSATGRLRIEQALSFFLKYPAGLALLSLILVWIGC